jgi:hypothetical protein
MLSLHLPFLFITAFEKAIHLNNIHRRNKLDFDFFPVSKVKGMSLAGFVWNLKKESALAFTTVIPARNSHPDFLTLKRSVVSVCITYPYKVTLHFVCIGFVLYQV